MPRESTFVAKLGREFYDRRQHLVTATPVAPSDCRLALQSGLSAGGAWMYQRRRSLLRGGIRNEKTGLRRLYSGNLCRTRLSADAP